MWGKVREGFEELRGENGNFQRKGIVAESRGKHGIASSGGEGGCLDFGLCYEEAGGGDFDAVSETVSGEVVIDEGWDGAQRPDGEGAEEEMRTVHEVNGNELALGHLVGAVKPSSIAEDSIVGLPEGPLLVVVHDKGLVGELRIVGVLLEQIERVQAICPLPSLEGDSGCGETFQGVRIF